MRSICSFCGNEERDDLKIVEGAEASICEECISTVSEEVNEKKSSQIKVVKNFLKPHEIKAKLDEYVIGQEEAKKVLSVAVYNHYKRIYTSSNIDIEKSNVILNGSSGSGKTLLMKTLSRELNVPMVVVDATKYTEAGYIGEDVETILEKLLKASGGDIEKAEKGIVYIDEIDKISSAGAPGSKQKDPSGEGVQQALLKIIEDSEIEVTVQVPNYGKVKKTMNTKNILFVAGGAFVGIEEIVGKRVKKSNSAIGFDKPKTIDKSIEESQITAPDIISFGLIPEFVGRFPVIVSLHPLDKNDLKNILTKPKGAIIKQYKALFKVDGVELDFSEGALDLIVSEAIRRGSGARGLRGVIETKMYNLMYELPQLGDISNYTVTEDFFKK